MSLSAAYALAALGRGTTGIGDTISRLRRQREEDEIYDADRARRISFEDEQRDISFAAAGVREGPMPTVDRDLMWQQPLRRPDLPTIGVEEPREMGIEAPAEFLGPTDFGRMGQELTVQEQDPRFAAVGEDRYMERPESIALREEQAAEEIRMAQQRRAGELIQGFGSGAVGRKSPGYGADVAELTGLGFDPAEHMPDAPFDLATDPAMMRAAEYDKVGYGPGGRPLVTTDAVPQPAARTQPSYSDLFESLEMEYEDTAERHNAAMAILAGETPQPPSVEPEEPRGRGFWGGIGDALAGFGRSVAEGAAMPPDVAVHHQPKVGPDAPPPPPAGTQVGVLDKAALTEARWTYPEQLTEEQLEEEMERGGYKEDEIRFMLSLRR